MVGRFLSAFVESLPDLAQAIGERLYPIHAAQTDPRPYVTYQNITGGSIHTLGGPEGVGFATVQINIVANSQEEASEIARLISGTKGDPRLNCFRGIRGAVNVKGCWLEDERDVEGTITHAQGRAPAEIQQDYRIHFDQILGT